jgi:hypothetical protein
MILLQQQSTANHQVLAEPERLLAAGVTVTAAET